MYKSTAAARVKFHTELHPGGSQTPSRPSVSQLVFPCRLAFLVELEVVRNRSLTGPALRATPLQPSLKPLMLPIACQQRSNKSLLAHSTNCVRSPRHHTPPLETKKASYPNYIRIRSLSTFLPACRRPYLSFYRVGFTTLLKKQVGGQSSGLIPRATLDI